ncbi:MAG: cyclic nucleotide-binding domain-containing protein [Candidatus Cloacimonetes bacterium]|nr:cyclic nucleotide-binding domain-containing protein [Candidatus Cloacimonadota bacterium]MCF7814941.1 cyclic nucleotide-binding domain-containing protein [Candidatus Cloacimonadota bacterium]MCF7867327.1 cyclic nucleotide-binding domain-containing protein [Candidatus Cloacimonadota bacterium]MCF7882761.1 cyclic nucleotide-binding domain-containing protein [Candidatus Cloacimonadota bacterium]
MDLTFLKKVELFKTLTQQELKTVASNLKLQKFKKDDILISEDEIGDEMFILYQGEVDISKKMSMIDDQEKIDKKFVRLKSSKADYFGEVGLLGKQKRTANCKAKTDGQLYCFRNKDFMKIAKQHPQIGMKIMMEIAQKLACHLERTNQDVLKLTTALIYALKE